MKKSELSEKMEDFESDLYFYDDCIGGLTERVGVLEERNGDLESAMIDLLSHLYLLLADEDRKEIKKIAKGLGMKLNKS